MPEGYTHVRTAQKAATAIHYKVQCPAAFAAGANGPDSFFCYEVWKKRAKRHFDLPTLGNRMHEEKTGAFLRSLCANVKTRPQVEYTLGFLSHYAADTVVHPFICAMCAPGQPYAGKGGHGYLEIALDSTLHAEDTGSALVPVDDVSPLPTGEELADITALLHTCLLETYGEDIPVEYLADAFWHTYRLRGLFPSKHGVRRAFFWLVEPLFGGRGFITGHVSPRQLDKRFSDLKLCQREQIAKWLREETNDYYTRHQRYPIGREAEDVVDNAYVQIVKAGIWIPYGEVYQYYLSRKARMMKHPLQG